MKNRPTHPLLPLLAAFAAIYLVWGSTYAAIRLAVETLPPLAMVSSRFLIAGGILYTVTRLRGAAPPTPRQWRGAAAVGTLMLVSGSAVLCWAEQYVPSGLAAAMLATVPMWTVVLHWRLFGGPRPRPLALVGIALGVVGVARLAGGGGAAVGDLGFVGPLAILGAACSWATGSLLSRRIDQPPSTFQTVGMQMLWAGIAVGILAVLRGEGAALPTVRPTVLSLAAWVYLTVVGTLVTLVAYVWLLRTVRPALVSTYAFVNPVIALLIGWLALGEILTTGMVAGAALVVVAVTLVVAAHRAPRPERTLCYDAADDAPVPGRRRPLRPAPSGRARAA